MDLFVQIILCVAVLVVFLDLILIWLNAVNRELEKSIKRYFATEKERKQFDNDARVILNSIMSSSRKAVDTLTALEELRKEMIEIIDVQNQLLEEINRREERLAEILGEDFDYIDCEETSIEEEKENEKV